MPFGDDQRGPIHQRQDHPSKDGPIGIQIIRKDFIHHRALDAEGGFPNRSVRAPSTSTSTEGDNREEEDDDDDGNEDVIIVLHLLLLPRVIIVMTTMMMMMMVMKMSLLFFLLSQHFNPCAVSK